MKTSTSKGLGECLLCGFAFVFIVLLGVVGINGAWKPVVIESGSEELVFPKGSYVTVFASRKLLTSSSSSNFTSEYGDYGGYGGDGMGGPCSKDNILVLQGQATPLPNGIPTYTVNIQNVCVSGCSIGDIHVSCGSFSSARMVDPSVFRRISYGDCLVKDGHPLNPGEALSFQYANTFEYPMSVSSVAC